ncbi:MAG TPA: DUF6636 domain-containing protein [Waterburya sp.]|jgi:hypothetical protein
MKLYQKLAVSLVGVSFIAIGIANSTHAILTPKSSSSKQQADLKIGAVTVTPTKSRTWNSTVNLLSTNGTSVIAQSIYPGFATPSGNIHCALVGNNKNALRCEISSGLNPKPPQPYPGYCEFDWGAGFSLPKSGNPKILCISDTIAGSSYSTLSYGSTWKKAGFQCVSRTTGLTCTNSSGQGFFLSRERWKVLTNPR